MLGLPLIGVIVSIYYAVNIPLLDDYHLVLDFVDRFLGAQTLTEKIIILFTPRNNQIIVTLNLLVLFDYTLFGEVNFVHFIIIANLLHLLILWLVYQIFGLAGVAKKHQIPMILLLAIPTFAVCNWSGSLVHLCAVFFILLTLLSIAKKTKAYFWMAVGTSLFATCSAGSGVLACLVPIPILVKNRNMKFLILWGIVVLINFSVQLTAYSPTIIISHVAPITYVLNAVIFFGAIFKAMYGEAHIWAGILGGLIVLILVGMILRRATSLKENTLILSTVLLSASLCLLITAVRSQLGLGATTAFRYRLYQALCLAFIYLFIVVDQPTSIKKFYATIVTFSLLLFVFRFHHNLQHLKSQSWQLISGIRDFQITGAMNQLSYLAPTQAATFLNRASQSGIYDAHKINTSVDYLREIPKLSPQQPMRYQIEASEDHADYYKIKGWAYLTNMSHQKIDILMVVKFENETFYHPTGPLLDSAVPMGKSDLGFIGIIDKSQLPHDWITAQIGLALRHPYQGIISEVMLD
jgi:hypothetical protein